MSFSIKEVAEEINLAPHTLRYYETEGLVPNIKRDEYGNRQFSDHDIEWLRFVRCLRDTGMPIKEMRHFVSLMIEGDHTISDRLEILYDHKKTIEEKMEEMNVYMTNIKNKINYYEGLDL